MNNETLQIILAIIGSGSIGAIVSGAVTLISKAIDKRSGIQAQVANIEKKLDEHIAESYRSHILVFQNELFSKQRHTYEQWNNVLKSITKYNEHCKINKVDNDQIVLAEEYIKSVYKQCQSNSDFAPMNCTMISEAELKQMINNMNQIGSVE